MADRYDVAAVGNAIVDLVVQVDESALTSLGCPKGQMVLVNSPATIAAICKKLSRGVAVAGGSAVNTAVGVASLGGRAAFIGTVARDEFGRMFQHDISSIGVELAAPAAPPQAETSRSLILVTPDGQRTMMTFLGGAELDARSVDQRTIESSKIVLLESYLFDKPRAKAAFRQAATIASIARRRVALSLPDRLCINRHRAEFLNFIRSANPVVIANEAEIKALYQTMRFEDAVHHVAQDCSLAALTRSERGSIVVSAGKIQNVPADTVRKVVDKTGAGDLYAAGFIFGLSQDMAHTDAARLGGFAASEIICQFGARPQGNLGRLARLRGLLPVSAREGAAEGRSRWATTR